MTTEDHPLCRHCLLPVGRRAMERTVNGESCAFCCYGCCIAYQVKSGNREEYEAAWLLIRIGVGGFLSMNIMLFSLLLYADGFSGADAEILPWIHVLLWLFATPAVVILGEPFVREAWFHAKQGRLTTSTLIVLGVGAAYAYSIFATIEGSPRVYFDTASMVLMLFTVGYYLDAAGRARAARDLQPLLAAESGWASVVDGDGEHRRPVREVGAGMLVRVRPGERIPVDGVIIEGASHTDEAVITGESRQIAKGAGSHVIAGASPPQPEPAPCGCRCRRVRADHSHARRRSGSVLGAAPAVRPRAADRPRGIGGRLSVRGRAGGTDGHFAGHRTAGPARLPGARPRRAQTAMAPLSTRCSRAPPGWNAIPSMAWPAPSSRRPPRADSSRSPSATFAPLRGVASVAVRTVRPWPPAAPP